MIHHLITEVEERGACLSASPPDKLKVFGKRLPRELIEKLRAHKAELLSLLMRQEGLVASWTEQERRNRFEERAAILEYDEGLSRVEAERLAKAHLSQEEGTTR